MITGGNKITGMTGPVQIYPNKRAAVAKSEKERGASARFDSVTLSEEGRANYAMQITGKLTQEVRAAATPGRLSALSQQIASGEYRPDPMSIARRMLLLPEEN